MKNNVLVPPLLFLLATPVMAGPDKLPGNVPAGQQLIQSWLQKVEMPDSAQESIRTRLLENSTLKQLVKQIHSLPPQLQHDSHQTSVETIEQHTDLDKRTGQRKNDLLDISEIVEILQTEELERQQREQARDNENNEDDDFEKIETEDTCDPFEIVNKEDTQPPENALITSADTRAHDYNLLQTLLRLPDYCFKR